MKIIINKASLSINVTVLIDNKFKTVVYSPITGEVRDLHGVTFDCHITAKVVAQIKAAI